MDLLNASTEQLITLPGIGEPRARTIREAHSKEGRALSEEELRLLPGIPSTVWDNLLENDLIQTERMEGSSTAGVNLQESLLHMMATIKTLSLEVKDLKQQTTDQRVQLQNQDAKIHEQDARFQEQRVEIFQAVCDRDEEIQHAMVTARGRLARQLGVDSSSTQHEQVPSKESEEEERYAANIQSKIDKVAPKGRYVPHQGKTPTRQLKADSETQWKLSPLPAQYTPTRPRSYGTPGSGASASSMHGAFG
jgi:hypothetical protein